MEVDVVQKENDAIEDHGKGETRCSECGCGHNLKGRQASNDMSRRGCAHWSMCIKIPHCVCNIYYLNYSSGTEKRYAVVHQPIERAGCCRRGNRETNEVVD